MKRIISIESIQIPFKAKFAHHSASREFTESIIVSISNGDGQIGYGESCPRSYVTGESVNSAKAFIELQGREIESVQNLENLKRLQILLSEKINGAPAAWCALEMAMLDLLAQEKGQSVEELLEINSGKDIGLYTAVLGIDPILKTFIKFLFYKALRFLDFKIKLSGNSAHDMSVLKIISFGAVKIRVDANNLFKNPREAIEYLKPLTSFIWAIEEPLRPGDFSGMKEIAESLKIKIILDESFLNKESLKEIGDSKDFFIPNVRISKLGGILRTLELVNFLEEDGYSWILGSHVGETSLLTRASFLVSGNRKTLIAKEGGFSTYLLSYDPFFPNLKFGIGGIIKNKDIKKIGWGMQFIKKSEGGK